MHFFPLHLDKMVEPILAIRSVVRKGKNIYKAKPVVVVQVKDKAMGKGYKNGVQMALN